MDISPDIKSFIFKIVQENFPEEEFLYSEFADDYIAKFQAGEDPNDRESNSAYSEFDPKVVESVANSISTLVGTIKTILSFRKKNNSDNLPLLLEKWKMELIASGLDEKKASELIEKYGVEIKKYIL